MRSIPKHHVWWPLLILCIALMSAATFTWPLWHTVNARERDRFEQHVGAIQARITERLQANVSLLRGAAGLVAARGQVSRDEFRAYVERLDLKLYPITLEIGWIMRVPAAGKDALIAAMRRQGAEGFAIWPKYERPEYYPITYLEPLERRNQVAIGHDTFTEPMRRAAMERARDTGLAQSSGKVQLLQEIDEHKQAGFHIYVPVYQGGALPETVAERRVKLLGFVFGAHRAGDLLRGILGAEGDPNLAYEVFDGSEANSDSLLHRSASDNSGRQPRFGKVATIEFAGRPWTISFTSSTAFEHTTDRDLVLIVLVGGVLLSFTLAGAAWAQGRARTAAEKIAADLWESRLELSAQREWFRTTLSSIGDAIITTDKRGRVTYLNAVAESLTGWAQREAEGASLDDVFRIVNEESRQSVESPVGKALREGSVVGLGNHTVLIAKGGTEWPIDDSAAPIRDDQGNIAGVVLIFREITERRRVAQALEASEVRYRTLFEAARDGVFLLDAETGRIADANPYMSELLGYSRDELLGKELWEIGLFPDAAASGAAFRDLQEKDYVHYEHLPVVAKNGRRWDVEFACNAYRAHGKRVLQCNIRDITGRKRVENALRESEERYRSLIEVSPQGVWMASRDGIPLYINQYWVDYSGMSLDQSGAEGWIEQVHPDDRKRVAESWQRALASGTTYEAELRLRRAVDGQYRWHLARGVPVRDAIGQIDKWQGVLIDIHQRKESEQMRTALLAREQALRTEAEAANRAKDGFLATLSHELRTPMNAILGWMQTLNSGEVNKATLVRALHAIEQSAQVQARLIEDLLNVSDIVAGRLRLDIKPLSLTTVIGDAIESIRPAIAAKGLYLVTHFDASADAVTGDAARIQQVVWNLLANAVKFTPRRGEIRLALARRDSQVAIAVEDNGQGINAEFLPYVFDRFRQADHSNKRKHGGLGLGLAIVRHVAELHGGSVEAYSAGEGQGARFTVLLPVQPLKTLDQGGRVAPVQHLEATIEKPRAARLDDLFILSVDDDANSREMLQEALERAGAKVASAASAAEALSALQRLRPDVLISDIGLPREDGYDLLRAVRALAPEAGGTTPAIALTGYAGEQDRLATEEAGYQAFVSKPVNLAELTATVVRVAAAASTRRQPQTEAPPSPLQ